MTRRRIACTSVGLVLLLACAAVVPWLIQNRRAQFPVRAFSAIELGMTRAAVSAVIGLPPGDYAAKDAPRGCIPGPYPRTMNEAGPPYEFADPPSFTFEEWNFGKYWIWITFDAEGYAIRKELLESDDGTEPRLSWFDRLRRRLRL